MSRTIRYDGGSDSSRTWNNEAPVSNSYRSSTRRNAAKRRVIKRRSTRYSRYSDEIIGSKLGKFSIDSM